MIASNGLVEAVDEEVSAGAVEVVGVSRRSVVPDVEIAADWTCDALYILR